MNVVPPDPLSRIRALLFPTSDAARHATSLPYNSANVEEVQRVWRQTRLPSPAPTEADRDDAPEIKDNIDTEEQLSGKAVVLRQTNDLHAFAFGTALANYFVLKHDPVPASAASTTCYYNYIHCQFFLDPDSSDMWLKNRSTSMQSVKGRVAGSQTVTIGHGESIAMQEGVWAVSLGEGVHFVCEVLPSDCSASSTSATISSAQKLLGKPLEIGHWQQSRNQGTLLMEDQVVSKNVPKRQLKHAPPGQVLDGNKSERPQKARPTRNHDTEGRVRFQSDNTSHIDSQSEHERPAAIVLMSTAHSRVEKQLRDGVLVAVKICRRPVIPDAADMWLQELKMLKLLGHHENVVSLLDSSAIKREIVLPYVPGQSVDKYVDHGKFSTLSEEQCRHIWRGSAAGLKWIHGKGILYNDMKPGNTMYDPKRQLTVLVDFGIATERIDGHFTGGGTPWYIAPEFLLRQRHFVGDIWSLAISIMFLLRLFPLPDKTEEPWILSKVFGETVDSEKMTRWHRKIMTLTAKIPPGYKLLRRMLDPNPTARIGSEVLVDELSNAGKHKPMSLK